LQENGNFVITDPDVCSGWAESFVTAQWVQR